MTRGGLNGRGALYPARFIVAAFFALAVSACSTAEEAGADSPRAAVDTYLAALNANDEAALRKVLSEPQRNEAAVHLSERGGKGLTVESVDLTQDFGPHFANAHVTGEHADRSRYEERLVVSEIDDRWYVGIPGPNR